MLIEWKMTQTKKKISQRAGSLNTTYMINAYIDLHIEHQRLRLARKCVPFVNEKELGGL